MAAGLGEYDHRLQELRLVSQRGAEETEQRLHDLERQRAQARALSLDRLVDSSVWDEVRTALLLPEASWNAPPPKRSLAARIRALLARFAAWLRRLFGRRTRGPPPRIPRRIPIAMPSATGRSLGAAELGEMLTHLSEGQTAELRDRVDRGLQGRERGLRAEAERKRRDAAAQERELEAERAEAERRAATEIDRRVREAERHRLEREFTERGLLAQGPGGLEVTYGLVEQFAKLLLDEESRRLPGDVRLSRRGSGSTGVYEKARLRQNDEVAHLDLPSSVVAARLAGLRHIDEATSYVYREITSERVHVVVAFDRSGSMAEEGKLEAAKRALLALYVAVRRRYPDATIDVLAFDNAVRVLDLVELWETKPGSFTNTAEALRTAYALLRSSRATRKEVYLLTDGLPESYTAPDGQVHSGNLDAALAEALRWAEELRSAGPLSFSMILFRSAHPEYEAAAREIARSLAGELIVTSPQDLGVELLVRWARGGTESVRVPAVPSARPAATPPPRPRGRPGRRRADRRMGG